MTSIEYFHFLYGKIETDDFRYACTNLIRFDTTIELNCHPRLDN